ncbi:hypothetical protein Cfor_00122, partial [Coptotermes formosanus]
SSGQCGLFSVTRYATSLEVIEPPSEEVLEKVRSEFGLNERRVREAVEQLKEWLVLQPHLPKEMVADDGRLERWLIRCKNSIEKVKKSLDLYYTLKTNIPEIMHGWDMKGDWFKSISSIFFYIPMPQLTPNCDRVTILGFSSPDITNFDVMHQIKIGQMILEIRISEDYCLSDIYILDFNNCTLGHVSKFTLPVLKKYLLCAIGGYNIRLRAMHVLNAPPYAHTLISMVKFLLKSKMAGRVQIHGSDLTSFYEQVPKKILPIEYGGEAGSIAENWDRWKKKVESYHDVFLEREKQKSDESKRPGHTINSSDLLGFEGSFRKLDDKNWYNLEHFTRLFTFRYEMSLEVIEPPSKEALEKVTSEFGLNERRVREAVEQLKNWIELQPHLPKETDDGRLERWLIRCKNSTEKVKKTLDLYYTVRTNVPEIMTGWDTKGNWFKTTSSVMYSGYNARIKAMHVLNAPSYADTIIAMLKSVLKSKLTERIYVHGSDLTSFYEQVPKESLPTEYGGNAGSVQENWDRWKKKLESYHDIFLEREKYKSDETKRPGESVNRSHLLGFEGSFRKLDVD